MVARVLHESLGQTELVVGQSHLSRCACALGARDGGPHCLKLVLPGHGGRNAAAAVAAMLLTVLQELLQRADRAVQCGCHWGNGG